MADNIVLSVVKSSHHANDSIFILEVAEQDEENGEDKHKAWQKVIVLVTEEGCLNH